MSHDPLTNPEELASRSYLAGVDFYLAIYTPPNAEYYPDVCQVCGQRFGNGEIEHPGELHIGYTTDAGPWWICATCFQKLRGKFGWRVRGE